jgi:hypothetical protein
MDAGVEYRAITEFPDYCVGNDGSVWSSKSGEWRRLKPSPTSWGYLQVGLSNRGEKPKNMKVHTLVLTYFVGPRPDKMDACHCNGNQLDNSATNLRWDTKKSNQADRYKHGTDGRGDRNPHSKLKAEDVVNIKIKIRHGVKYKVIANEYGILPVSVCHIKTGYSWSHIVVPTDEELCLA